MIGLSPSYPINPKTFGDYIRKYRKDKGLSIKDFAKELGVTENTVINWEKRGRRLCTEHLQRLEDLIPDVTKLFEGISPSRN